MANTGLVMKDPQGKTPYQYLPLGNLEVPLMHHCNQAQWAYVSVHEQSSEEHCKQHQRVSLPQFTEQSCKTLMLLFHCVLPTCFIASAVCAFDLFPTDFFPPSKFPVSPKSHERALSVREVASDRDLTKLNLKSTLYLHIAGVHL